MIPDIRQKAREFLLQERTAWERLPGMVDEVLEVMALFAESLDVQTGGAAQPPRKRKEIFDKYASDGWTGDAVAIGEPEFYNALDEMFGHECLELDCDGMCDCPQNHVSSSPSGGAANSQTEEMMAALRFRIHVLENHNQNFERCESAWCHPSEKEFCNPALEMFRGAKRRAEEAEAKLAAPSGGATQPRNGIYIASKTHHAEKWKALRASGVQIISTWIDEAGIGETVSFENLWLRCIREVSHAERLIVYSEPGEELKGALIEVGAALASGVPVWMVGPVHGMKTAQHHPLVRSAEMIEDALSAPSPGESAPAPPYMRGKWLEILEHPPDIEDHMGVRETALLIVRHKTGTPNIAFMSEDGQWFQYWGGTRIPAPTRYRSDSQEILGATPPAASPHQHQWVERWRVTEPSENGFYMLKVWDGSFVQRAVPSKYQSCACGDDLISAIERPMPPAASPQPAQSADWSRSAAQAIRAEVESHLNGAGIIPAGFVIENIILAHAPAPQPVRPDVKELAGQIATVAVDDLLSWRDDCTGERRQACIDHVKPLIEQELPLPALPHKRTCAVYIQKPCDCGQGRPSAKGWVPCAERMPDIGAFVLVAADGRTMLGYRREFYIQEDEMDWQWQIDPYVYVGKERERVTHWRPLPPAPAKEGKP